MAARKNSVPIVKRWIVAARPFAYTGSVLAVVMGAGIAFHRGVTIRWGLFTLTLLGTLCFHTAANMLNDCFDHRRGLDTEVYTTSGAVVRGWLTEKQVFRAAILLMAPGALCGFALAWLTGWTVIALGALGAVMALGYTTSKFCFKYAGAGDLTIFIAFGMLPVFGSYWVQAQQFDWLPILWSIPLCMLTVAILHANNWRDIERDTRHQCRTIASLLGVKKSKQYYRFLVLGPFALIATLVGLGQIEELHLPTPPAALISFLALPLAYRLTKTNPQGDLTEFAMLDEMTARVHLVYGVLCTASFWISPYL